jgi:4-amino-4-deoxy-L-arabinose transferase-like glycosyltransferase
MTTDESYYWVWSQRPQLSYFDHPPFVAWLMSLGNLLQNFGNAIRWPGVILGHCSLLIFCLLLRKFFHFDEQKISWWFWLALFSPLLGFGSMIVTPDLPLVFFWVLSLYCFFDLLQTSRPLSYIALGASLGLGFCSKYHIVLFLVSALIYLTLEKKWSQVRWQNVPLTILFGALFSAPVLLWNFQNDFASFRFQISRGLGNQGLDLSQTGNYLVGQIVLLFPILIWLAIKARPTGLLRSFLYFSWLPIIFFFLSSFRGQVEANWTIMAFPTFLALAASSASNVRPLFITNLFWISIFVSVFSHQLYPWIPAPPEKVSEYSQFKPIIPLRERYQPLYASTYQMASAVWYETKVPFYKLNKMSRRDLFDSFPEGIPDQFPIYVVKRSFADMPDWVGSEFLVSEIEKIENDFVVMKVDKL